MISSKLAIFMGFGCENCYLKILQYLYQNILNKLPQNVLSIQDTYHFLILLNNSLAINAPDILFLHKNIYIRNSLKYTYLRISIYNY